MQEPEDLLHSLFLGYIPEDIKDRSPSQILSHARTVCVAGTSSSTVGEAAEVARGSSEEDALSLAFSTSPGGSSFSRTSWESVASSGFFRDLQHQCIPLPDSPPQHCLAVTAADGVNVGTRYEHMWSVDHLPDTPTEWNGTVGNCMEMDYSQE